MTRKEAKKELAALQERINELTRFLDKTCRHANKVSEETSGGYDYFRHYETWCRDCGKTLSKS